MPGPSSAVDTPRGPWSLLPGIVSRWHRGASSSVAVLRRLARVFLVAGRRWVVQWQRVWDYLRGAGDPWRDEGAEGREAAAAAGVRAFALGLVLAGWAAVSAKNTWMPGLAVILAELLWAAARFVIIAWLMPRGAIDRRRLSVAYLAGLLPFVVGVTAPLRVVALVASAYLTRQGLRGAGVRMRDVDQAIAWSFGGQIAVATAGWLGRVLLALVIGA